MAIVKLAPNVPVAADIKYVDIVPSEKGDPQVRLKGKFDGETGLVYLPGKLPDVLTALVGAGVIANKEYPMEVEEPSEIKPLKRQFSMMKAQLATEKYGTFKIVGNGSGLSAATPVPAMTGAPPGPVKSYSDLYGKATDYILSTIVPKYKTAKLDPTPADVRAMVGDLFAGKLRES